MQIQIDGQGIDVTASLRDLTMKKLKRGLAHFDKVNHVHVILKVDNDAEQSASANVTVPGTLINAHAKTNDMYKTIDLLVHNLTTQLTKYKQKHSGHRDKHETL